MCFNVILDLFFEFVGALNALNKNDAGFYDLSANFIGSSANSAFKNIGELHNNVFDFERSDTIAGRLDNVVRSADIPEITVLITPGNVAGVVHSVVPGGVGFFLIFVITEEKSAGDGFVGPYDNFAVFTGGNRISFAVNNINVITGGRSSHRTRLEKSAGKVSEGKGGFGLAETFRNAKSGCFFKLIENFRVKCFAGGGCVLNGGKVIFGKILFYEHAVHGRRCAEGGDMIFRKHRKDLCCIKSVEVIGEDCAFAEPLAIKFSPKGFSPAGIGNCEVKSVAAYPVPVFCGYIVSKGIFIAVGCNFRISGGAGSEEHKHRVVAAGSIFVSVKAAAEKFIFAAEIVPAFSRFAYDDFGDRFIVIFRRKFSLMRSITDRSADDCFYVRRFIAIFKVVLKKLVRCGNCNCTDFMKTKDSKPEIDMALEDKHYSIAFFDSERGEIVCRLGGMFLHIAECIGVFGKIIGNMYHSNFVGLLAAKFINNIKCKVELIGVCKMKFCRITVFIGFGSNKGVADKIVFVGWLFRNDIISFFRFFIRHYHCKEGAVASTDGNHSVRSGRFIENGVAFVKDFIMVADLDFKRTFYNKVKFLSGVGCGMDRLVLKFFGIFICYPIWCTKFSLEKGSKVLYADAVFFCGNKTFTFSCNSIMRKI